MKKLFLALVGAAMLASCVANAAPAAQHQEIFANGSQASVVIDNDNSTGIARMDPIFRGPDFYSASVTFEPGVRTNWHYHHNGQLLIVTAGSGLTQEKGQPIREIKSGDIVWCPPGVIHWHGGGYQTAMTHIAVAKTAEGPTTTWLDKVTDEEYHKLHKK